MKTMEVKSLSFLPPSTTHFPYPTFQTKQRVIVTLPHSVLKITRPILPYPPLKTTNKTLLISNPISNQNPPKKEKSFSLDTNQSTSSDIIRLMDGLGLIVTPDIYASLVVECTKKRDAFRAKELFAHMKRNRRMVGFLNQPSGSVLLNRILMMFVSCGCLDDAHQLFDEIPNRDSISLAIMIGGFVNHRLFGQALDLFAAMHWSFFYGESDIALQVVSVCVLEACMHLENVSLGKVIHGWLFKIGYGRESFVGTALIEFYGKFGCLSEVNIAFHEQVREGDHCDTMVWRGAIVNNCRGGHFLEVVRIFAEMGRAGVRKDENTFSSVLKACVRVNDSRSYGRQVHANAIKLALDTHILVMCGLVDMYGRCGLLNDARKVFDMIDHDKRNRACWKAMVTGFIQQGLYIEAIKVLYEMKAAGMNPQESLIDEVRLACGSENFRMRNSKENVYMNNIEPG